MHHGKAEEGGGYQSAMGCHSGEDCWQWGTVDGWGAYDIGGVWGGDVVGVDFCPHHGVG